MLDIVQGTGGSVPVGTAGVGGTTFGALTCGIAVYPAPAVTPEPSSAVMLGRGGAGAWLVARRRARSRRPA